MSRKIKKCFVANNLEEFIRKGKLKFTDTVIEMQQFHRSADFFFFEFSNVNIPKCNSEIDIILFLFLGILN